MISHTKNYYRIVIYLCILIYLAIHISMQYLHLTKYCRIVHVGDRIRVEITRNKNPIVLFDSVIFISELYQIRVPRGEVVDTLLLEIQREDQMQIEGKVREIEGVSHLIYRQKSKEKIGFYNNSTEELENVSGTRSVIDGLYCKISLIDSEILRVKRKRGLGIHSIGKIQDFFSSIQQDLVVRLQRFLPEPHASLAAGVLLGVNSTLSDTFYAQLVDTGTLHVVAASGYNISIVLTVVSQLCARFFDRKNSALICILAVVCYVFLAGASPAVIRAGLMGSLLVISTLTGRIYVAKWGVIISSLVMLFFSPLLIMNISFQLSVTATVGIIWLLPKWQKKSTEENESFRGDFVSGLKEAFLTTVAASVMTMPIIMLWFGRLSSISFIANTLLIGVIPYLMFFTGVLLFATLLPFAVAQLFSIPVWILAQLFIVGVQWMSKMPFASIEVSAFSSVSLFVWYLLVWIYIFYSDRKSYAEKSE